MNKEFTPISPLELSDNVFKLIGSDWTIITATDKDGAYNGMTASWGGLGILWNKPVCFCFIRPQRYTYEFAQRGDKLTLSFFDEKYRSALRLFGAKSGRDMDKAAAAGLTPVITKNGVYYEEARLVLSCKTVYSDMLKEDSFLDPSLLSNYKAGDFHRMYICEIVSALTAE